MSAFMAVGVVAFIGFAGVSIDAMRGYLVQSRLSSALDAAGLAGARVMYSPTRDADIQMYFDANFPAGYLGSTVTGPTFTVTNDEVITLSAQATIDTTLMHVLGFNNLTVGANAEITRETEMLDVVLAIDMSGSMGGSLGGGTRISAARDAANILVDILFGTDGLAPLLKIGLVPWNGKVNVTQNGVAFDPALTQTIVVPNFTNPVTGAPSQSSVYLANNSPVPLLSAPLPGEPFTDTNGNGVRNTGEPYTDVNGNGKYDNNPWQGCVFNRYLHDGTTNDADMDVGPVVAVGGKDWPAWEVIGWQGEPISSATCPLSVGGQECTSCLTHGVTPLASDKTAITAAINQLTSPTGTTNILGGLSWAWRVLVPEAPFTEADLNPQGQRTQAIILLTDGEYTGGSGDGYKAQFGVGTAAQPQAEARLRLLSTKIKDSGVVIYTIQFANTSGTLAQLMKDVATGPDAPFYHAAPSAAELTQVFQEIANDLSQLRVSM